MPCFKEAGTHKMKLLLFAVCAASLLWGTAQGSTVHSSFSFDPECHHLSIGLSDKGRIATKLQGEDYQTALLKPTIPAEGRSYVEIEIQEQAEEQCFIGLGVCKGTHDYLGGRSALAAKEAWMMSTHSGKFYTNEGDAKQYLSGMGTAPFYPGDDAVKLRSVRPRAGDKVGLLVDMGRRELTVVVNGEPQGVMADGLPDGLRFAVDLSDEGQRVRIVKTAAVPPGI